MKVSIIGAGYVGLVTGVCLAAKGHNVRCVEVDSQKVARINKAIPTIFEDGLQALLEKTINKNFIATTEVNRSVIDSEITLIAVGTPFNGAEIDLTYVKEVSRQVGAALKGRPDYHVVVVKSTVVPGTTDTVVLPLLEENSGKKAGRDFGVGMNPEFLTEGQAVSDFMNPDRIVLGTNDAGAMRALDELYADFEGVPVVRTNCRTAEMIKYVSNGLLALNISYANEISDLCSSLGSVDVVDVMKGVHLSGYLSPKTKDGSSVTAPIASFLQAGCGFGGSCLPKDVKALIAHGAGMKVKMRLLKSVIEINEGRPDQVVRLLQKHFPDLKNIRIAVLGLSFKQDTDDMRESPAIPIIKELLSRGAVVKAYDPVACSQAAALFPDHYLTLCDTLEAALEDVHGAVLVTSWEQFRAVPELLSRINPNAVLVDGRRIIDKHAVPRYEGIGA
jgi:UDPglucose 6-dehydrogenase/GDP-mannose 6-dehydrogenase